MMESVSALRSQDFKNEIFSDTGLDGKQGYGKKQELSMAVLEMVSADGVSLYNFLKSVNLLSLKNLVILPSNHQYYYDEDDFRTVRTLISLRQLDLVEDLDAFLSNLFHVLPTDTIFVGYFSDRVSLRGNELLSGLLTRINSFFDSKTGKRLNKRGISELLERSGFWMIDMREINGFTYLYSQKLLQ